MKELPSFTDFITSIDKEKFDFDLGFFQRVLHYEEKSGPLTFEAKKEVALITSSILLAYLQAYHIWLSSELHKKDD